MKLITLLSLIVFQASAFAAGLEGVESPDAAAKDFFSALKKGSSGIETALDTITGLNSESRKYSDKNKNKDDGFDTQLKKVMVDQRQGKVVEYKVASETIKMGGDMIKREYTVRFAGGQQHTILFIFMRPTINGNHHVQDIKFND